MSNYMRMTDSNRAMLKNKYIVEFSELLGKYLSENEMPDGKLSFVRSIPGLQNKAVVYFSAVAWAKMVAIISAFDKEVAWHGLVEKLDTGAEKAKYLVYDIAVYPQEVTGATVNTDQKEYERWLDTFNDEDFRAIRMQGHSHVNMGVTPSSVDMGHKEQVIKQLDGDMFYIFMIWNKKFQHNITIYDLGDNIAYEDKDVEVKLYDDDGGLDEFITNAKALVKDRVYLPATKPKEENGKTPSKEQPKNKTESKERSDGKTGDAAKSKPRTSYESFWRDHYSFDDEDPYSPFGYRDNFYGC